MMRVQVRDSRARGVDPLSKEALLLVKDEKLFSAGTRVYQPAPTSRAAKVFSFFFSKKNNFLHLNAAFAFSAVSIMPVQARHDRAAPQHARHHLARLVIERRQRRQPIRRLGSSTTLRALESEKP